jgi:Zn-dependent protease with chaperone function
MRNKLDTYLHEINLSSGDIRILIQLAGAILLLIITLLFYFFNSKRNRHLESLLKKVTGKNYIVRVLPMDQPNGFCFGGVGNSIFLTKGLIKILNEREVISVCLHEAGHITNLDSIKMGALSLANFGVTSYMIQSLTKKMTVVSNAELRMLFSIVVFIILVSYSVKVTSIFLDKINEYRADKYTVKFGYGNDLISALTKLENWVKEYKFKVYGEETKFEKFMDKIQGIVDAHPSTENRVKALFESVEMYEAMLENNSEKIKKVIHKFLFEGA